MRIIRYCCLVWVVSLGAMRLPDEQLNKRLVSAIKIDKVSWVKRLINEGANANYRVPENFCEDRPVLMLAISSTKNPAIIKELLASGADPRVGFGTATPILSLVKRFIGPGIPLTEEQFITILVYLLQAGAVVDELTRKFVAGYPRIEILIKQAQESIMQRIP